MEESDGGVVEGYLLLADISGYTKFLTGTELEHSYAIVKELTSLVRQALTPPMQFVKIEGDAVLCFAPHEAFPRGELLLELVESCYYDFANRLLNMVRSTTCACDACRAIDGLDLKFVAHQGGFIVDRDDKGGVDLAGPNVILAHRLLKNTVIEQGGPRSYAFFTASCLDGTSAALGLPAHHESYDSFGDVKGFVQDLGAAAERRRAAQVVRVTDEDADAIFTYVVDAPPAVCWQYFVDPGKRLRHIGALETAVEFIPNAEGRVSTGATSHCAHSSGGDALREYLDWRPYEYFTCSLSPVEADSFDPFGFVGMETYEFNLLEDGRTEHRWLLRSADRSPEGIDAFEEGIALFRALGDLPTWGDQMRGPILEDAAMYGLGDPRT